MSELFSLYCPRCNEYGVSINRGKADIIEIVQHWPEIKPAHEAQKVIDKMFSVEIEIRVLGAWNGYEWDFLAEHYHHGLVVRSEYHGLTVGGQDGYPDTPIDYEYGRQDGHN